MDFSEILFSVSLLSGLIIFLLCLFGHFSNSFQFWPPPDKESWQIKIFWILFTLLSLPFFILIALDFDKRNANDSLFTLGTILSLSGLILANIVSYNLGFKNTSGQADKLRTSGWYSFSRNPVYVFTILALAGVIITVPTFKIIAISSIWIFIYILAPFIEEPWLLKKYGSEYLDYTKRVRRFL